MSKHVMHLTEGSGRTQVWQCNYCHKQGKASLASQPCPGREQPSKGRKEYVNAARDMLSVRELEDLGHGIGVFNLEMTAIIPFDAEDEKLVDALVARREKAER